MGTLTLEYLREPEANPMLSVALVAAAHHHILQALAKITPRPYCPEALALEEYLNSTDPHKQ